MISGIIPWEQKPMKRESEGQKGEKGEEEG